MQRESERGRIVISFKVRPDLKERLQALATRDSRTLSAYIELALEGHAAAAERVQATRKGKTNG